jgi:AraC family transcriptional regulator
MATDAAYALVAEVLALVEGDNERAGGTRPPAWLLAARDRVHAAYAGPCRVAELADEAGVHRVHLARAFRRHFGCSITEYRQRLRLRAAAAGLAKDGRLVSAVAADAGFADHSHLCRAFRAVVGVAPAGYRALVRAG